MKRNLLLAWLICLLGLFAFSINANAQSHGVASYHGGGYGGYSGYHGSYSSSYGYHGGYYGGYGYHGYPGYGYYGGYRYPSYGYGGYYGYAGYPYYGGYPYFGYYGNNTIGYINAAANVIGAIGTAVAINNPPPPVQYGPSSSYEPASAPAPAHVVDHDSAPHPSTSSSSGNLPHGFVTAQGTIHSPWSKSEVSATGVTSGTVLYDAFTGQRYTAP